MLRAAALRLLLVAIALPVAAALGEGLVRAVAGPPARLLYSGSFRDVQTDWDVVYGVNERSQRITCGGGKRADARQVAVVGDSFVFGQGVADCEDFVSRLDAGSDAWRFRNFGLVGSGIVEYIVVARDLLGDPVERVVVLFYGNDIVSLTPTRSFFGPLADRFSSLALLRRARHAIRVRGLLGDQRALAGDAGRVRRPEWTWEGRHNNTVAGIRKEPRALRLAVDPGDGREALFREHFAELARQLRGHRSPDAVYVAMVPEGHTVSRRLRRFVTQLGAETAPFGEPGPAYALVRSLSREQGFHFIETFDAFLSGGDPLYHPHDLHWTAEGHRTMASLVAAALGLRGDGAPPVRPSPPAAAEPGPDAPPG